MKLKLLAIVLFTFSGIIKAQKLPATLDVKNTFVVIVGVLEWNDKESLHSFENKNRKDVELYKELFKAGVPATQMIRIFDKDATLERMNKELDAMAAKSTDKSTFIFYYAGHGIKKERETYFANYDIDVARCKKTGFGISYLSGQLIQKSKSSTFIFMADCCYSGSLLEQGKKVSDAGKNVIVMTSATASNTSTGNWTFTQTLMDGMRGDRMMDRDADNKIGINDYKLEFADAMKYREHQMGGFYSKGVDEKYSFAKVTAAVVKTKSGKDSYANGRYAAGLYEGDWQPVRIINQVNSTTYNCRFYFYSDYVDKELSVENIKTLYYPVYKVGDKVKAEWEGKNYDAEILKAENDFYYIHYIDDDDSYDEWVMYDRIFSGKEKKAEIEYEKVWYPGEVITEVNDKYFIRYTGYSYSWDELVSKDRIKF
jgi:hypothetical protein